MTGKILEKFLKWVVIERDTKVTKGVDQICINQPRRWEMKERWENCVMNLDSLVVSCGR